MNGLNFELDFISGHIMRTEGFENLCLTGIMEINRHGVKVTTTTFKTETKVKDLASIFFTNVSHPEV